MKKIRNLPIPFVILILAGIVAIYSLFATRCSGAATVQSNSAQVQTVEQERMAVLYFGVLSWVSDLTPQSAQPLQDNPQPVSSPQVARTSQSAEGAASVELCTFHAQGNSAVNSRTRIN